MKVKVYDSFYNRQLKESWNKILDKNGYFLQNSYEWCSLWWKYFHNKNRELYIITVFHKDNIVGIAPLYIEKKFEFRQLKFIDSRLTDYHQFLVERSFYEDAVEAILENLTEFKKWDLVYLDQISEEDSLYKYLESKEYSKKKHRERCPIVDINDLNWDEYINNIKSSSLRKDYLNRSRKLEREADLKFIRINTEKELILYIEDIFRLYGKRWLYKNEHSKFKQDNLRLFIKEVFLSLAKKEKVILYVLKDGENLISYWLGFLQNDIFYGWNTSFNTDYHKYSPGKIITGYIIYDLFQRDYKSFNFMRGDEEYKTQWMHKNRKHVSNNYLFIFSKNSAKGKIMERYYLSWRDKIKERFKKIINHKHIRKLFRLDKQ